MEKPHMSEQKVRLKLPQKVTQQLELKDGDQVKITLRNNDALIQSHASEISLYQRISLAWFVLPAVACSLLFNGFFAVRGDNQIPLSGNTSLATGTILLGVIMGTILFGIFFVRERRNQTNTFSQNIYWRNFPVIILSFALILGLTLLGSFWLFETMFDGLSFDRLTATIIFFVFETIINYLMILLAFSLAPNILIRLFTLVIVSDVLIAMASNTSRRWWQYNLSFLGTKLASNSWQFNITLIFSALIMVALVDYIFVSLHAIYPHSWRLNILRSILTLMAVDLGAVGFFPNNAASHYMHDKVAGFLVYFIIVLIVGIRWLLPGVTREFLTLSYTIGAILVAADILFQGIGYLSLTAFEIIGFALSFGWVVMLLQLLQQLIGRGTRVFYVKAKIKPSENDKDLL
ncbi:hypothetical protein AYR62_11860 [Secundilactobacillus paracollinoides]|uniref:Uncharacterized protein n=2 Tax=Secundilactobacillus paracollinoides TaxID=240427 RepID=A0A1B2IXP1_9LACO|nr:hypothetical protein AYR61_05970 [Secundilactobacillus paracollinoides]ANZ64703.1 hypothetical protein AYR62_11860 [Secundilactobacillus paracollinoides]ANZ66790.1 hypothetical protein AYR63_06340 [Secundilactobacillus paracollinoides]KRL80705.1 hypothetical protein FC17_GL003067 [Secundilactobacillus paracollinoides DSM 15502 = JCM 11969]